jgi:16S rRNA (cytidine1402-2'-O)-methyltransferase
MTQSREYPNGLLSLVATPIGNLEDITLRALRTLRDCAVILAEDTRRTQQLLRAHGVVHRKLLRFDDHASPEKIDTLTDELREGALWFALTSDAGTPLVSDPGAALVRAAVQKGIEVEAVPGASAVLSALQVSTHGGEGFRFIGFLPRDGVARATAVAAIARDTLPTVLYESPHRVHDTLTDLAAACGLDRQVSVSRELTKLHETTVRGSLGELLAKFVLPQLGEFVLTVEGATIAPQGTGESTEMTVESALDAAMNAGLKPSAAARDVAQALGLDRAAVYQIAIARSQRRS